jgi:hypothetical protein
MAHILGRAGPGPQLGWVVPDLCRAKNYVLWVGLLGTAQMYTYSWGVFIASTTILVIVIDGHTGQSDGAPNMALFIVRCVPRQQTVGV